MLIHYAFLTQIYTISMQMSIEEFPSHTISGNIEVLTFNVCNLGVIHAFFISGLAQEMFALEFQSSVINQIHPQVR